jgi:hypothetical protein
VQPKSYGERRSRCLAERVQEFNLPPDLLVHDGCTLACGRVCYPVFQIPTHVFQTMRTSVAILASVHCSPSVVVAMMPARNGIFQGWTGPTSAFGLINPIDDSQQVFVLRSSDGAELLVRGDKVRRASLRVRFAGSQDRILGLVLKSEIGPIGIGISLPGVAWHCVAKHFEALRLVSEHFPISGLTPKSDSDLLEKSSFFGLPERWNSSRSWTSTAT